MSKRQYTKFKSEYKTDIYVDLATVESFEQDGEVLILHKDSGQWSRVLMDSEKFFKILNELDK